MTEIMVRVAPRVSTIKAGSRLMALVVEWVVNSNPIYDTDLIHKANVIAVVRNIRRDPGDL